MNLTKGSILFVILAAIVAAVPASEAATCSNASVKGVYGLISTGLNGSGVPASSVKQYTFDGNGNFTGLETKSINGSIVTYTSTGTYQVAKTCAGSATGTNQDGDIEHGNFFLNTGEKGALMIQTDASHVESGSAVAQGTATCTDLGVKHTYSFEATGIFIGTGPIAAAGQFVLNGTGTLTGTGTFSVNGSISTLPLKGTYQINSNCTGTLAFTPQGQSAINLAVVIVEGGKELMFLETDANTVVAGTLLE